MAKTWKLANRRIPCGAVPDCWIEERQAYCELSGYGWAKLRCERHLGEEAPAEVYITPEPVQQPPSFTGMASLAKAIDVKARQANDGE